MDFFDTFHNQWIGKRVSDPLLLHVGMTEKNFYQCVSYSKEYISERFGIPNGYYGDAIDWWNNTPPIFYPHLDRVGTQDVQKGDIVIIRPNHIGMATGKKNSSQFELNEQNGSSGKGSGLDGDAIRDRWISSDRIAGVLRPKVAPVAPTPLPATYSKRTITPKRIVFNKDTHLYNLSLRTIEEIVAPDKWVGNVIANATAPLWVDGIIDHISGHSYYTHEEPFGYATEDCDDYQEPVIAPYMPPAAPVEVPKAEKYTLVVPVMSFETANAAWSHNGQSKTLVAGEYYVISKKDNLYNLSTDNMKDKSQWVNTADNVLPVEPLPVPLPASKPAPVPLPDKVIATITAAGESAQTIADDLATNWKVCSPLKLDDKGFWQPVKYVSTNSMPISIRSLDGKTPATLTLPAHKELDILSTFDSGKYARDVLLSDRHRFYALPMSMLTPLQEEVEVYSRLDVNHDGEVRIDDFIDYGSKFFKSGVAVVRTAAKAIKTEKVGRFIDGIKRGSK